MTVSLLSSIFCLIKKKSSTIAALLLRHIILLFYEKRGSRVHGAINRFFSGAFVHTTQSTIEAPNFTYLHRFP